MVRDIPVASRFRVFGPAQEVFSYQPGITEFSPYHDISAPVQCIALLMKSEVVGMLHDPLAVGGTLPGQDGFGRIHSNIDVIGDVASKEVYLHS